MGNKKVIAEHWQHYVDKVLPDNAQAIQISECRQAFYSGAAALFLELLLNAEDFKDEPTAKSMNVIDAMYDELDVFLVSIGAVAPEEH